MNAEKELECRIARLEELVREQNQILRSAAKAMCGLQSQCEALSRLSGNAFDAILVLAGERQDTAPIRELSEAARREIETLEKLYSQKTPDPPKSKDL